MQVKTHISVLYTAWVTVPELVWEQVGHLPCYEQFHYAVDAKHGAVGSGEDKYSGVEMWADFRTEEQAQAWVADWVEQINKWSKI